MFKHILLPFDGSPSSRKALEVALGLAQTLGSQISLLSVEERIPRYPGAVGEVEEEVLRQREYYGTIQREALDQAKLRGLEFSRADILVGHVAQTIVEHGKAIKCDVIIMGHSGRSGVWGPFLGTTVEKVSRHAGCSVVIVR